MKVQHTVSNIRPTHNRRYIFDASVEFRNGSVFTWELRDCTLVKGARAGDWLIFGPSRFYNGEFKELVTMPFPVMMQMRETVLDAIREQGL